MANRTAQSSSETNSAADYSSDDDDENLLKSYMREMFGGNESSIIEREETEAVAYEIISAYNDRKPLNTNVLEYWYERRFSCPLLFQLASIVLGAPASQVSVERCFSVLKFILGDYRSRINKDTLENIMLIHLN